MVKWNYSGLETQNIIPDDSYTITVSWYFCCIFWARTQTFCAETEEYPAGDFLPPIRIC